jgi:hypothetical protein
VAKLFGICCECVAPMAPADYEMAVPGERWYRCPRDGWWEDSELAGYLVEYSAYERMVLADAPRLPGFEADAP